MKFEPATLRDVYVITPEVHEDARGFFMESFRADELAAKGITETFVQDNHARSFKRNTVRGFHFQYDPPMSKIVRVTRGSAYLVAVDLRQGSPTMGKWFGVECSEDNKKQMYVPVGFAFAYQTLFDECEVQYKCSALYNPQTQGEIRYNDPEIAVDWLIKETPVLSESAAKAPSLHDWLASPEAGMFVF